MPQINPYKIAIPQEKVDRLKQKLALADFPTELDGADWEYGTPLAEVKRLTEYWHQSFDWKKAEAKLNELPHFATDINVDNFETLNIHFVHQKSEVKGAIPLLFAHGWPGSFHEVVKILPELVHGSNNFPAFHVVAPSLPSFGFSEGTKKVRMIIRLGCSLIFRGIRSEHLVVDNADRFLERVHDTSTCRSMPQAYASPRL